MDKNTAAFLGMLALSEGTSDVGDGGYNCIVGSTKRQPILFGNYADHPRIAVQLRSEKVATITTPYVPPLVSTAAGRYQILARNYDAYRFKLKLADFGPFSQDAIALEMIRERGALDDVEAGRVLVAVSKCKNIWASLPGAGYSQNEHGLDQISLWYQRVAEKSRVDDLVILPYKITPTSLPLSVERFIQEYVICGNVGRAYRAAFGEGNSRHPASAGRSLLVRPEVKVRLREHQDAISAMSVISTDTLVRELEELCEADVNELISIKVGACRYCWGVSGPVSMA